MSSSYWLSGRGRWSEPSAFMMNSSAYGCGWLRTSGDSSLSPKRELLKRMKLPSGDQRETPGAPATGR